MALRIIVNPVIARILSSVVEVSGTRLKNMANRIRDISRVPDKVIKKIRKRARLIR
jgi:hypothetical protein